MLTKKYFGAIDVGSRNCRLLIIEANDNCINPIDIQSRIVDLGEKVAKTKRLSKKAMERTLSVLHDYKKRLHYYPKIMFKAIATEACRRATNQNSFVRRVEYETGIKLEVIDPFQEAFYALKGCESLINDDVENVLIFDIGGGSTELIWAKTYLGKIVTIIDYISIPYGVITVSEQFSTNVLKNYQIIKNKILDFVNNFSDKNNIYSTSLNHKIQFIGTSGTTTLIAALHMQLRFYDRNKVEQCILTYDDVQTVIKQVQLMSPQERMLHPTIGFDKEELVLGGIAIFEGLHSAWPHLPMLVTSRGVRDGIIHELIN